MQVYPQLWFNLIMSKRRMMAAGLMNDRPNEFDVHFPVVDTTKSLIGVRVLTWAAECLFGLLLRMAKIGGAVFGIFFFYSILSYHDRANFPPVHYWAMFSWIGQALVGLIRYFLCLD